MLALKLVPGSKGKAEGFDKFWSCGLVAFSCEMEAVVGEAFTFPKSCEEVCELKFVFLG